MQMLSRRLTEGQVVPVPLIILKISLTTVMTSSIMLCLLEVCSPLVSDDSVEVDRAFCNTELQMCFCNSLPKMAALTLLSIFV